MLDEEHDTLAAEYVLGTLSAEEREHAEALLSFDPGFEAAVRQWERRLGELNVMVEAVEPPPEPVVEPDVSAPRDLDTPAIAAALAADLGIVEAVAETASTEEPISEAP